MQKTADDTLGLWREEGRELIPQHYQEFRRLLAQANSFAADRKYVLAAVHAQMAALYAFWRHSGLFVSSELEQILWTIGRETMPIYPRENNLLLQKQRQILHVASAVHGIGGLSRMIWRWIQQDTQSSHSLVLTQQTSTYVPSILKDAVLGSGGKIISLNETTVGGILAWAKRLRKIAALADIVVLHTWPDDAIPVIAFANKEQTPPILLLDHADHGFWMGASISDIVVNLRSSGMNLSKQRRGIEPDRITLLPIILPLLERELSQQQAKQKLGFDPDSILLLSIARAPKYKTIDQINFADAHVPLLKKYKNAVLVVIGSDNHEDWSAAVEQTEGRIKILAEREDTHIFYQAADIYVDSYPLTSITSLLEAGSYGVPLVTRFPYAETCQVIGADAPGLDRHLLRTRNLEEYTATLSYLVENEAHRTQLGSAVQTSINQTHRGKNWQNFLEHIYAKSINLPRVTFSPGVKDAMFMDELDLYLTTVFANACGQKKIDLESLKKWDMMPYRQRFFFWMRQLQKHGFGRSGRIDLLIPQWIYWKLRKNIIDVVGKRTKA
jgi:glycosyltransferase involved in cell wall biosynthesis